MASLSKEVALIPPRVALGSTMLFHGLSKVRGEGPAQTEGFMRQLAMEPARELGLALAGAELFAGAAMILGIGTRLAALAVLATQGAAVAKVHGPKGFDTTQGGFEWNLALMSIAAAVLIAGPGRISVHEATEHLVEGRGVRGLFRRARPTLLDRVIRLIK